MPKTKICDDIGYMAIFSDTEGNAMACIPTNSKTHGKALNNLERKVL